MADIRKPELFMAGRWKWSSFGYEIGFPRGCQFTDVDAAIEFDGHKLFIEAKECDGVSGFPVLSTGQRLFLSSLVDATTTVLVLYGNATRNDPLGVFDVGRREKFDWRQVELDERRAQLKWHIDRAMGVSSRTEPVGRWCDECEHSHEKPSAHIWNGRTS